MPVKLVCRSSVTQKIVQLHVAEKILSALFSLKDGPALGTQSSPITVCMPLSAGRFVILVEGRICFQASFKVAILSAEQLLPF